MNKELTSLTIQQLCEHLRSRSFSAEELARAYLSAIEKKDTDIRAYFHVMAESALDDARRADELFANGKSTSALMGIPLAIKDNILVDGVPCTAGSRILENYISPYDATAVERMKKAGAVILGKTNMDEFAMGSSTENSAFGATRNPHDVSRVPGGSSGGSAAAVAAQMCAGALGSDTGGSVRQPAAFCGVVGFKPTYGAVSRHGLMAMASSLDQIGPLAKTVGDVRLLFESIGGHDAMDSTSLNIQRPREFKPKSLRIGVPKEYFVEGIDASVRKLVQDAIHQYEEMGATLKEISLPHTSYALAAYYIIMPSEVSSNLARYDGIRYGLSEMRNTETSAGDLQSVYAQSRGKGFGREVRRRMMLGTYTLSAGYYDAYYVRAQKVRTLIARDFEEAFTDVDMIMTPTTPNPAFQFGEKSEDPVSMYLSDIFTVSVNLAGLPAISVPCGTVSLDGKNLPAGLQIIGPSRRDYDVLEIASWFDESKQSLHAVS